jgi:hypothetical protein
VADVIRIAHISLYAAQRETDYTRPRHVIVEELTVRKQ